MPLYVYSGKCRMGTVGQATPFTDADGRQLFVGDIVLLFTDNYSPDGLTAVVSDEFTTYSNGEHRAKDGPIDAFVMGIKSVDLTEPNQWRVRRVKQWQDVVAGERWNSYGFNYQEEDA